MFSVVSTICMMYPSINAASVPVCDSAFWPWGEALSSSSSCSIQLSRFFSVSCFGYPGLRFPWILQGTMVYDKLHVMCDVSHYFMNYSSRLWQREILCWVKLIFSPLNHNWRHLHTHTHPAVVSDFYKVWFRLGSCNYYNWPFTKPHC